MTSLKRASTLGVTASAFSLVDGFHGHLLARGVRWVGSTAARTWVHSGARSSHSAACRGGLLLPLGFLITKSKMGRSSTPRYFWRRIMRIFPGWFLILIVTAYVFAPIAWMQENGTMDGFWNATAESPFNVLLEQHVATAHAAQHRRAWVEHPVLHDPRRVRVERISVTLAFEFGCYILVAILGIIGALSNRRSRHHCNRIILLAMMQCSAGRISLLSRRPSATIAFSCCTRRSPSASSSHSSARRFPSTTDWRSHA